MASRQPQAERILSTAAGVENLVTWLVAKRTTADPFAFHIFMTYAADRIPVNDRIKMLGEVIDTLPRQDIVYAEFLDDLRFINEIRVQVAHSFYIGVGQDDHGPAYVKFRRGVPRRIPEEELRSQVGDALKRAKRVREVIRALASEVQLVTPEA